MVDKAKIFMFVAFSIQCYRPIRFFYMLQAIANAVYVVTHNTLQTK